MPELHAYDRWHVGDRPNLGSIHRCTESFAAKIEILGSDSQEFVNFITVGLVARCGSCDKWCSCSWCYLPGDTTRTGIWSKNGSPTDGPTRSSPPTLELASVPASFPTRACQHCCWLAEKIQSFGCSLDPGSDWPMRPLSQKLLVVRAVDDRNGIPTVQATKYGVDD